MMELVESYSLHEIVIFLVIFSAAIKGIFDFWDWLKAKVYNHFNKEQSAQDKDVKQDETIKQILATQEILKAENQEIKDCLQLLIESDKDSIKSFIIKEHHYYCYEREWIDDYSLDAIERRYKHYTDEGGNSFVHTLVEELRALPRKLPE